VEKHEESLVKGERVSVMERAGGKAAAVGLLQLVAVAFATKVLRLEAAWEKVEEGAWHLVLLGVENWLLVMVGG
jgi:hypothetical protein